MNHSQAEAETRLYRLRRRGGLARRSENQPRAPLLPAQQRPNTRCCRSHKQCPADRLLGLPNKDMPIGLDLGLGNSHAAFHARPAKRFPTPPPRACGLMGWTEEKH